MKALHLIALTLLIATNSSFATQEANAKYTAGLINALKSELKDPDSLKIKDSYMVRRVTNEDGGKMTTISLCGFFNSRNGYGGYGNWTPFVSTYRSYRSKTESSQGYSVGIEDEEDKARANRLMKLSPFEQNYWNGLCVDDKHPPRRNW